MMDAKLANGWSSLVEQDQERAERLLLEILDREPNNGQAHKMNGILRRFQGRLSEARAELETAIALDPNDTFSLRNLGITRVQIGQPDAAIPYIEKSIRLSPNDPFIAPNYAWLVLRVIHTIHQAMTHHRSYQIRYTGESRCPRQK